MVYFCTGEESIYQLGKEPRPETVNVLKAVVNPSLYTELKIVPLGK